MSAMHVEIPQFRPFALSRAPIVREGRILRDLSMPVRDWSKYEVPAYERSAAIRATSGRVVRT